MKTFFTVIIFLFFTFHAVKRAPSCLALPTLALELPPVGGNSLSMYFTASEASLHTDGSYPQVSGTTMVIQAGMNPSLAELTASTSPSTPVTSATREQTMTRNSSTQLPQSSSLFYKVSRTQADSKQFNLVALVIGFVSPVVLVLVIWTLFLVRRRILATRMNHLDMGNLIRTQSPTIVPQPEDQASPPPPRDPYYPPHDKLLQFVFPPRRVGEHSSTDLYDSQEDSEDEDANVDAFVEEMLAREKERVAQRKKEEEEEHMMLCLGGSIRR